jgi:uncharacterized protein DUF4389
VKWLLAIPHFLVLAVFVGGGVWLGTRTGDTNDSWDNGANAGWSLVGLLVLIAAIVQLLTGRYPTPIYDFVMGMQRWALRVGPYAALRTATRRSGSIWPAPTRARCRPARFHRRPPGAERRAARSGSCRVVSPRAAPG